MSRMRRAIAIGAAVMGLLAMSDGVVVAVQGGQGAAAAVPIDLKPLLAARVSEMRLVTTRYNADRSTINANYAGPNGFRVASGGAGRYRGGGAPTDPNGPVPISPGAPRAPQAIRSGLAGRAWPIQAAKVTARGH